MSWQVQLSWPRAVALFPPRRGDVYPVLNSAYLLSCGWHYGPGMFPVIWRYCEDQDAANSVARETFLRGGLDTAW